MPMVDFSNHTNSLIKKQTYEESLYTLYMLINPVRINNTFVEIFRHTSYVHCYTLYMESLICSLP